MYLFGLAAIVGHFRTRWIYFSVHFSFCSFKQKRLKLLQSYSNIKVLFKKLSRVLYRDQFQLFVKEQNSEPRIKNKNPTIFNILYTGLLGRWSKYYFDILKIKQWIAGLDLGHSKIVICIFVKNFSRSYQKNNTWN